MRRPLAHDTEVRRRVDEAAAEMVQPNAFTSTRATSGFDPPVSQRAKASRRPVVAKFGSFSAARASGRGAQAHSVHRPDGFLWLLRIAAMEEVGDGGLSAGSVRGLMKSSGGFRARISEIFASIAFKSSAAF